MKRDDCYKHHSFSAGTQQRLINSGRAWNGRHPNSSDLCMDVSIDHGALVEVSTNELGYVDPEHVSALNSRLWRIVEAPSRNAVLIDVSCASFLSVRIINVLERASRQLSRQSRELFLCGGSGEAAHGIRIASD